MLRALLLLPIFVCFAGVTFSQADQTDQVESEQQLKQAFLQSFSLYVTKSREGAVDLASTRFVKSETIEHFREDPFGSSEPSSSEEEPAENIRVSDYIILLNLLSPQVQNTTQPIETNPEIHIDTRAVGGRGEQHSTLYNYQFPSRTMAGVAFRALAQARWPSHDLDSIEQRQQLIREIVENIGDISLFQEKLAQLRSSEPHILALYDPESVFNTDEVKILLKEYDTYDQWGRGSLESYGLYEAYRYAINTLRALNLIALLNGIFSYTTFWPYGCLSISFGLSSVFLVEGLGIAMDLITNFSGQEKQVYKQLREHLDPVYVYLKVVKEIASQADLPASLEISMTAAESEQLDNFLQHAELLIAGDPQASRYYTVSISRLLLELYDMRVLVKYIIHQVGQLDLYLAIASKMQDSQGSGFSYANLHEVEGSAFLNVRGMWNPLLDYSEAVSYSLEQGVNPSAEDVSVPQHLLLSGATGSGKSTLIRAVTINSYYLAQTFGIAAAESYTASPLSVVLSYMDKHDRPGISSGNAEEAGRTVTMLTMMKALPKNGALLACFDEFYSTTNPEAGVSLMQDILQQISSDAVDNNKQAIILISTHYDFNSSMVGEDYSIMHMGLEEAEGGHKPSYQLKKGPNKIKVSLSRLSELFKDDLPELAQDILNSQRLMNGGQ